MEFAILLWNDIRLRFLEENYFMRSGNGRLSAYWRILYHYCVCPNNKDTILRKTLVINSEFFLSKVYTSNVQLL